MICEICKMYFKVYYRVGSLITCPSCNEDLERLKKKFERKSYSQIFRESIKKGEDDGKKG